MATVAGDEDPARVVDPDLLHGRVVEEGLERAEAGHPRDQLADDRVDVGDRRDDPAQGAFVVVADHALRDPAYEPGVALRVDALTADVVAHLRVEALDERSMRIGHRHRDPRPE